jgi:hypothetical protein
VVGSSQNNRTAEAYVDGFRKTVTRMRGGKIAEVLVRSLATPHQFDRRCWVQGVGNDHHVGVAVW